MGRGTICLSPLVLHFSSIILELLFLEQEMYRTKFILVSLLVLSISPLAKANLSLNIKIGQLVAGQLVEVNKTIAADYNKDIFITAEGLKNNFIVSLKKFKNVVVNGKKINPVQIDMKIVNQMNKMIGEPQTVTSFFNRSAEFAMSSNGESVNDINLSVHIEDVN